VLPSTQAPILVQQQLILILQAANQLCAQLNDLLEKTQQLMDELGQLIPAITAFAHTRNSDLFVCTPYQKSLACPTPKCHYPGPGPYNNTTTPCLPGKTSGNSLAQFTTCCNYTPPSRSIFYHWKLAPSAHAPAQTCNSHNLPYV